MGLEVVTEHVHPNEGVLLYAEVNRPVPRKGLRRLQIIKVIRGDRLATYKHDLGPAEMFIGSQIHILGGEVDERTGKGKTWHTVGELCAMGEELRHRDPVKWAQDNDAYVEPGTSEQWLEKFHDEKDRKRKRPLIFTPKG